MGKTKMKLKIKNNVHVLRAERRMSQEQLAGEIEVTRATINSIEKGNYNPSLELAFRIAEFFEKDITEIFSVEGRYE
ncbi:MAG: transcriptional regulator [Halobacteriovoraceae bacterium]|nr:transcriptional regulator [Peredibacter sp.]MBJ00404.1 transcriptional regulator [Halobacteriovoraceae bacterium]|tara:strand:+ start:1410 stop:1640 length:231 start_codon:yes stop_codon:yes gene_type:complete